MFRAWKTSKNEPESAETKGPLPSYRHGGLGNLLFAAAKPADRFSDLFWGSVADVTAPPKKVLRQFFLWRFGNYTACTKRGLLARARLRVASSIGPLSGRTSSAAGSAGDHTGHHPVGRPQKRSDATIFTSKVMPLTESTRTMHHRLSRTICTKVRSH